MESIDLVDRLIPDPSHTIVIATPSGGLVLVNTSRDPREGQTVLRPDKRFAIYEPGMPTVGIAYCAVKFL